MNLDDFVELIKDKVAVGGVASIHNRRDGENINVGEDFSLTYAIFNRFPANSPIFAFRDIRITMTRTPFAEIIRIAKINANNILVPIQGRTIRYDYLRTGGIKLFNITYRALVSMPGNTQELINFIGVNLVPDLRVQIVDLQYTNIEPPD